MRKSRSTLLFFVLLVLGLSLAVPAEDVPGTAYDESETVPYVVVSPFSIVPPSLAAEKTLQRVLSSFHFKTGFTSLFAPVSFHDGDANRTANAQVSSALLRTLRC